MPTTSSMRLRKNLFRQAILLHGSQEGEFPFTIVVGSESLSKWRQLLGTDPVEELLRRGKGFTIWVVE